MAKPDVTTLQRSDLNQFLFAGIGTEANGTTLSVLSVFARLGSDPWSEASRLATLPRADAVDSLAHMISGMPKSPWTPPDALAIAVRLIGLLPARPVVRLQRTTLNWPVAAAIAVLLLLMSLAFISLLSRIPGGKSILGEAG